MAGKRNPYVCATETREFEHRGEAQYNGFGINGTKTPVQLRDITDCEVLSNRHRIVAFRLLINLINFLRCGERVKYRCFPARRNSRFRSITFTERESERERERDNVHYIYVGGSNDPSCGQFSGIAFSVYVVSDEEPPS